MTSVSRSGHDDEAPEGTGTGVSADRGVSSAPRAARPKRTVSAKTAPSRPTATDAAASNGTPDETANTTGTAVTAKRSAPRSGSTARSAAAKTTAADKPTAAKKPRAPRTSAAKTPPSADAQAADSGSSEETAAAAPSKRTSASRAASAKAATARGEAAKSSRESRTTTAASSPAARSRAAAAASTKRQSQRVAASVTTETTAAERAARRSSTVEVVDSEIDETTRERPAAQREADAARRAAASVAAAAVADDAIAAKAEPAPPVENPIAETTPSEPAIEVAAAATPVDVASDGTPIDTLQEKAPVEVAEAEAPIEVPEAEAPQTEALQTETPAEAPGTEALVEPDSAADDVDFIEAEPAASDAPVADQAVVVIPPKRTPAPRKKRTLRVARPAPAADAPRVLAIDGLVKRFGSKTAVDGISLDVRAGSFYGIVGPNGAGKTTTLSMITGLLRPDAGQVRIHDIDAWADPIAAKRATGVLPDRLRLFDRLTGAQLLTYSGSLRGLDAATVRERSADLIAAFGLDDAVDRLVADYSAGMTKKIALACAMIHAPRLLVLDEPFESVDPVSAANLTDILERYVAGGGTVVLSSHSMDLIERVCDSAAIIIGGRVLAHGELDEVRAGQTLEDRFVELAGGRKAAEGMEWLHSFSD